MTGACPLERREAGPVSRDRGNREALVFTSMHSIAAAAERLHVHVLLSFL